jgi:hypothetical protein
VQNRREKIKKKRIEEWERKDKEGRKTIVRE